MSFIRGSRSEKKPSKSTPRPIIVPNPSDPSYNRTPKPNPLLPLSSLSMPIEHDITITNASHSETFQL